MKCTITRRYSFEAAHRLPYHHGKCRNLHGHRYELAVSVRGYVRPVERGTTTHPVTIATTTPSGGSQVGLAHLPDAEYRSDVGMVMDFGDLDAIVNAHVIRTLDHICLNDIMAYPSAEHIAVWIWYGLAHRIDENTSAHLVAIELAETERGSVRLVADDFL